MFEPNNLIIYSLELGAALLYWLVIVVVESAMLQFVGWGDLRQSLKGSMLANLASSLLIAASLFAIPRLGLLSLLLGFLIALPVEAWVLKKIQSNDRRASFSIAFIINLVSFGILILPIYFFTN